MTDSPSAPVAEQAGTTDAAPAGDAGEGGLDAILDAAIAASGEAEPFDDGDADAPQDVPFGAPEDWRADQRDRFDRLPAEAKALVLEQYKDFQAGFTRKSQKLSEQARFAETVQAAFAPYRPALAAAGMDEAAALRQLLQLHALYSQDPRGFVERAAALSGIAWGVPDGPAANGAAADPNAANGAAADPNAALAQRLRFVEGRLDHLSTVPQRARAEEAAQTLARFRDARDEAGTAVHPHFDRVRPVMGALIQTSPALSLDEAYQRAIAADPELSLETRRSAALARARKAGRSVKSAAPASGARVPNDLDAVLSAAMDRFAPG